MHTKIGFDVKTVLCFMWMWILLFVDSLLYLQIALSNADKQTTEVTQAKPCKKVPIGGNYCKQLKDSRHYHRHIRQCICLVDFTLQLSCLEFEYLRVFFRPS